MQRGRGGPKPVRVKQEPLKQAFSILLGLRHTLASSGTIERRWAMCVIRGG